MLFPVLLLVGLAVLAATGSSREPTYATPPAPLPPPGPLFVLCEYKRVGAVPPPPVILCAIAEAQALGRDDIAHEIMRVYVLPVVEHAAIARARDITQAQQAPHESPHLYVPAPMPERVREVPVPTGASTQLWPPEANYPGMDIQFAIEERQRRGEMPPQMSAAFGGTDDEIQAMLDRDPRAFVESAMHTPAVIDVEPQQTVVHSDFATQPGSEWDRRFPPGHPLSAQPARQAPIAGVAADAWAGFCARLRREDPSYQSNRHVGCFRQRKDRLVELGIDPQVVAGSEDAQRIALDTDIADAYHHVAEAGLADAYVGRELYLAGNPAPIAISLSGVLGVVQAAGLEGAASWLESSADRRQFKHTTEAFKQTNGIF